MKYPSVFFCGLDGIEIPYTSNPGLRLKGPIKILTDVSDIQRLVGQYQSGIGIVEYVYLRSRACAVAFARTDIDIEEAQIADYLNGHLIRHLSDLQTWIFALWLIKDNAANADTGWIATTINNETVLNNNKWSSVVTKADGSFQVTKFTREELQNVRENGIEVEEFAFAPVKMNITEREKTSTTKLTHKSLRFQRLIYFVGAARAASDVAIKIANYCSALEALVSSSQTELSHQVSERTACLLHPAGENRLAVFRDIKKAYGIRSKTVHGAYFKSNEESRLIESSIFIDQICRLVARLYLTEKSFCEAVEGGVERFDDFWSRRIFTNS